MKQVTNRLQRLICYCAAAWALQPTPVAAQSNGVLREVYTGIGGTAVSDLTNNASFPNSPTTVEVLTAFEAPTDVDDNYGQRLSAYLAPSITGSYTFWISSDDNSTLFLSTDSTPANKQPIASVPGWTSARQWFNYAQQQSAPVTLMAGQRYYIEALMKEGGGGDNLAVTWQRPGDAVPANGANPIPNGNLQPYGLGPPQIAQQPTNVTVIEGGSATFNVQLARTFGTTFQWKRGIGNISGATNLSYTLFPATLSDNNAQFSCSITNAQGSTNSSAAILTVQADVTAPTITSVVTLGDNTIVSVLYSEPVEAASATNKNNYSINGAITVAKAAFGPDSQTVVLTTSPLSTGVLYTLTVNNVRDRATTPNTIAANTQKTFSLDFTPADIATLYPNLEPIGPSSRRTGLVISEIMYHPTNRVDGKVLEFVELYNSQVFAENISGYRLSGEIDFTFPTNTTIAAGAYLVVAPVPADIQSVYGITGVLGGFTNHLANSSGTIRLRNKTGAVLLEANYSGDPPWPVAADGAGHSLVLARPTFGERNSEAWAASDTVGGTPGSAETSILNPYRTVVINEFLAHTDLPEIDYIELYNYSSSAVNLAGCVVTDDPTTNRYVIPGGSIAARGFLLLDENTLGFRLNAAGETIYLKSASGNRVIDAVRFKGQENGISTGRYPDGAPGFYRLIAKTKGGPNARISITNIVLNEIMYNPISGTSDDEFVELYNRGASSVNLGGWKLSDAISFTFPTNVVIPAGGYVVVANKLSQLLTNHPTLTTNNTFGNYGGTLGNSGDRVALTMPDDVVSTNGSFLVTNIIHIVVDEVTYRGSGRWGKWADGGGSSLESVDPHSNHRLASDWADSDESNKSGWTNIEYTGVLDNGNGSADSFQLFLQGPGECLVDNVEVFKSGGPNLIANSDFEAGLAGSWFPQGTHDMSYLENTGGYGGSGKCLHVVASGRGDTGANRVRAPLTSALAPGDIVTLRAKIRWLKGNPEILLRLHGDWLEAYGNLVTTRNLGTPGAPNSRAAANAGPSIHDVSHSPVIPAANQAITVSAQVSDTDGLASLVLKYRIDPATNLTSVSMSYGGAGIYTATIPGQATNTLVAFHIQASDNGSPAVATTFPNDAPTRECLVRFGETTPNTGRVGTYRFWITQATNTRWTTREKNSNEPLDATFVYGNSRVVYNIGALYSGSPWHTPGYNGPLNNICDYVLQFPDDDLMLGANDFVMASLGNLDNDSTAQREQTAFWMLGQLGIPTLYRRHVNLFVNGQQRGLLYEDAQQPSSDIVDEWFPNDNSGDLHKIEDWFEFDDTGDNKLFNVDATLQNFTTTGGAKKLARYRWNWRKRAVSDSANNYTNLFALVDAVNSPQPEPYASLTDSSMDLDEWARVFAVEHIVGNWDSYGYNRGKNMYGYKPDAGKWTLLAWDIDFNFDNGGDGPTTEINPTSVNFPVNDPTIKTLLTSPTGQRAFWRALDDAVNGPLASANVSAMMNAKYNGLLNAGIGVSDPNSTLAFISSRRTFTQTALSSVASPFSITSNGGNNFSTNKNYITLTGTAPVGVKTIEINGIAYPVTWTGVTTWTLNYALGPGVNSLTVQGYDLRGVLVSGSTDTISITYTGASELPQDFLVINEIMYNPAVPNASFVEIYNKSAITAFDVSNFRLDGADFAFPEGTIVQPGGFLVIVNDPTTFAATYGSSIPIAGVFDGSLQNNGETLKLVKPGATPPQDVLIDEVTYDDQPPWPTAADGFGPSLQLIDPNQDNNRVANWAASATNSTPQWQFVTVTGTASTSRLYIYMNSGGDVYIDDLTLVAGAVPEVGVNMMQNGDFESALTGPWTVTANCTGSAISSSIVHSGNGSLHLVSGAAGTGVNDSVWEGTATLTTNAQYTLSYWYLPSTNGSGLTIRLSGSGIVSTHGIAPAGGSSSSPYTPGAPNSVRSNLAAFPLVWLNEVQPNNVTGLQDNFGDRDPWVELYNSSASAIDLSGYYLSDNYTNLLRWAFPGGTTLAAGQHLIVWVDGEPGETSGTNLHTSFRIPPTTGSVVLTRSGNPQTIVDYLNYSLINNDRSYGAFPDGTPGKRQKLYYATPGQPNTNGYPAFPITVNEWMASNSGTLPDPADNNFDDWFELYNSGPVAVDLSGFHLTDNLTNTTQFTIPNGYSIPANGYLLVWADNDTGQNNTNSPDLHVNFKLSGSGEAIGLFAPNGTNVDSITFGLQTNNVSQGRYPDGNSGSFYFMTQPTPRGPNTIGIVSSNQPPVLNAIGNKSGNELSPMTFIASASDPNTGQTLTFTLDPGAPAGAAINPNSGTFTWTPTEAQGPGTYSVTIRVTDNGSPVLSDFETISITVNEVNTPPALAFINDQNATEGVQLSFTALGTDSDLPAQSLTFSLDPGAPPGAGINGGSGLFTWIPSENQGPGTYSVTIRVTDNGSPAQSTTETFNINVAEANLAPVLNAVANTNVTELSTLNLTLTATDSDLPTNTLTFALVSGPIGASVTPGGLFTWTPTEAQGPSTNPITVKVSDNGSPSLSSTQSFSVIVFETNSPPVLAFINDQNATPGTQLIIAASATDPDLPTNTLSYSLSPGAPTGAAINPSTGVFTWTPATNQAPATNMVTVRVTDNGSPALSDSKSFTIVVASTSPLQVTSVSMASNGALSLAWDSQPGKVYEVQYKDSLTVTNWTVLGTYPATGATTSATNNTAGAPQRYYRINQTN